MRQTPTPWKHGVVLVCTNERAPGAAKPSCGRARGEELKRWLKEAAREGGGAAADCRVLSTGCLDVCPADGVAVALLPGDEVLVVDPEVDRAALLTRVQAHMTAVAEAEAASSSGRAEGGHGGRLGGLLGRLRRS